MTRDNNNIQRILTEFSHSRKLQPIWNIFYCIINRFTKAGIIANNPSVYLWYARHFKPGQFWQAPSEKTDLIIEGAGGCATHSFVTYVKTHNPQLRIAHTCEVPAVVIYGVKNRIPVIVLSRNMLAYLTSVTTRFTQVSFGNAALIYTNFHKKIFPYREKIILAPFEKVIASPKEVLEQAKEMYDLNINSGDNILPRIRTTAL